MNDTNYQELVVSGNLPEQPINLNQTQEVEAYLVITNPTKQPIELHFNSGQLFDIYLYRSDGHLVKQWSQGRMFTQAFQQTTLMPGQQQRFGEVLPLTDEAGQALPAGDYRIKVEVKTSTPASSRLFRLLPLMVESPLQLMRQ